MNIKTFQIPRQAALLALACSLTISGTAFAGGLQDFPADIQSLVTQEISIRFETENAIPVSGGELRVYDTRGGLIDRAEPNADGSYTVSKHARGKLRFVFEDKAVARELQSSGQLTFGDSGEIALWGWLDPKIDRYASLMGVQPSALYRAGDHKLQPGFDPEGQFRGASVRQAPELLRSRSAGDFRSDAALDSGKLTRDAGLAKSHLGNDSCDDALPLTIGTPIIDTLAGGPSDGNACAGLVGGGLWYSFTGDGNKIRVTTDNSPSAGFFAPDTVLNIYTGDCSAPVCLPGASNDDSANPPNFFTSESTFCTDPGVEYFVEVETWGNFDAGAVFQLDSVDLGPPPPNSTCEGATPMVLGVPVAGDTNTACAGTSLPGCSTIANLVGPENTLYYSFTGTGAPMTVSTDSPASGDTIIRVYCASCDTGLDTCVAADDDSGGQLFSSETTFCSQLGAEYVVAVNGWFGGQAAFELTVTSETFDPVEVGDICSPTTLIAGVPGNGTLTPQPCSPIGAACIKCLDAAKCIPDVDELIADAIGATYKGDGTGCIGVQGGGEVIHEFAVGTAIPTTGGFNTTDTQAIAQAGDVIDVAVGQDITHTFIGDLLTSVTHVDSGSATDVWDNRCGATDNIFFFWDDAFPPVPGSTLCINFQAGERYGMFPGTGDLTVFQGLPAAADWRYSLTDVFNGDGGSLNRWILEIETGTFVRTCDQANNGLGNGVDPQPGHSDNCNDCPE